MKLGTTKVENGLS